MAAIQQHVRNYTPKSLALRVSYKCNIGCRFCYNISLPNSDVIMPEEQLLSVIEQCRANGFTSVGFSGGEIFLFAPVLYKCIKRAKEVGYTGISIVTNGYWGKSIESAKRTIASLVDTGFAPPKDRLSMSAGEFHNEFIDWSYARNIAKHYFATFAHPLRIDFEVTPGKEHLIDEFKAYMKEQGVPDDAFTLDIRKFIANVGRWKEADGKAVVAKPIGSFKKCTAINRFVVDPDGKVLPCCGFNRFIDGISVGNLNNNSVAEVIEQAQNQVATRYLTLVPMGAIYEELIKRFELPKDFSVICEVCEAIFSKKEHMEYLAQRADEFLSKYEEGCEG
ncbi:MAG: radical SAM protein [Gallionella sp.]|nr:radical SAM protein [Gallionella sp.]